MKKLLKITKITKHHITELFRIGNFEANIFVLQCYDLPYDVRHNSICYLFSSALNPWMNKVVWIANLPLYLHA